MNSEKGKEGGYVLWFGVLYLACESVERVFGGVLTVRKTRVWFVQDKAFHPYSKNCCQRRDYRETHIAGNRTICPQNTARMLFKADKMAMLTSLVLSKTLL